jgi:hypothetical protein
LTGAQGSEIYTEGNKRSGKPLQVTLNWKLKNSGEAAWPKGMKLRLLKCYPDVTFSAKSQIAELAVKESGNLTVSIDLPENYPYHFMILYFKL